MSLSQVERLREIMARLRAPDGCPWDREQTHASLAPYLIEECCELLDAIDSGEVEHMREELGDVLLQVVFHAQLAAEAGRFDLEQVAAGIADKLVRRHPHVFGETRLETSGEVLQQWDQIKAAEKGGAPTTEAAGASAPLIDTLPRQLPALLRAVEIVKRLAKKHALPVDPALLDAAAIEKIADELNADEAGRRLFELAAACRRAGIDPESALRRHVARVAAAAEAAQASAP